MVLKPAALMDPTIEMIACALPDSTMSVEGPILVPTSMSIL